MKLPFNFDSKHSVSLGDNETYFIIDSLSTMLTAGIPITEALSAIQEDSTNPKTKALVKEIIDDVTTGKTISECFAKFPNTFDGVFVNIIKSGESSGNLDKVLEHAAERLKVNIETKGNIKSALFYPLLVLGVLFLVGFFVFGFSLPKVATVFFDLKIKLPSYSVFILNSAIWFGNNKYLVVLIAILISVGLYLSFKIKFLRDISFGTLSVLPISSGLVRLLDLSRFTGTLSLLLSAGVPIIEALEIAKNVVLNKKTRRAVESIRTALTEGKSLGKSMHEEAKSFPSLLQRVVGVGEETGNLDKSLGSLSQVYEKKFADIIKNLTVIIEPVLIIFIAVLVALVLVSVILPIYQGIGSINRH